MSQAQSHNALDDASSWNDDAQSLYSDGAPLLLPSKDGSEAGFASVQALSRGLQVPSRSYRLTSGFEYPAALSSYGVSEEEWTRFTGEITAEAKMSSQQWRTVIGAGLGTMAIGGIMLGFFGAIPAVMVARRKRAHQETQNLAASMASNSESALSHKINQWNETFFRPKGIVIRIDMPYDSDSLDDMDLGSPSSSREGSIGSSSEKEKMKEPQYSAREKARNRGRIVIIPLNQRAPSIISQATTLAEKSPYIPAVYD